MGERSTRWLSTRWAGLISDQWCVPTRTNRDYRSLSHGHTYTNGVRPYQTSSNGGGRALLGAPVKRFAGQTFRSAQASLSRQNEMAALPRATPRSSQRSNQGQHTFACSATFQRTHHHPLDTASITTRNVLCVTVWDHRGARAMASTRGFLNIQSLNELTYENVSFL